MNSGYIYLIQTPQHFDTSIYKIGSTKYDVKKRFRGYDVGAKCMMVCCMNNYKVAENELIDKFKETFTQSYAGREYFEGDSCEMSDIIYEYFKQNRIKKEVIEVKDDTKQLESIFHTIQNNFARLQNYKYFSSHSPFLRGIETEYDIDKLLYSPSINNDGNVRFDKYVKDVEKEFKKSGEVMKIRYLFNLRETLANMSINIKNYENEAKKLNGIYLKFTYKVPKDNSRVEYKRLVSRCHDSKDNHYNQTHWS